MRAQIWHSAAAVAAAEEGANSTKNLTREAKLLSGRRRRCLRRRHCSRPIAVINLLLCLATSGSTCFAAAAAAAEAENTEQTQAPQLGQALGRLWRTLASSLPALAPPTSAAAAADGDIDSNWRAQLMASGASEPASSHELGAVVSADQNRLYYPTSELGPPSPPSSPERTDQSAPQPIQFATSSHLWPSEQPPSYLSYSFVGAANEQPVAASSPLASDRRHTNPMDLYATMRQPIKGALAVQSAPQLQSSLQPPPPPPPQQWPTQLLTFLAQNRAQLSNVLQLLPLAAQTFATIPKVLAAFTQIPPPNQSPQKSSAQPIQTSSASNATTTAKPSPQNPIGNLNEQMRTAAALAQRLRPTTLDPMGTTVKAQAHSDDPQATTGAHRKRPATNALLAAIVDAFVANAKDTPASSTSSGSRLVQAIVRALVDAHLKRLGRPS